MLVLTELVLNGTKYRLCYTLGPTYNDAKITARFKCVLIVHKLFNIKVNYFDATLLVVTELVLSGAQCNGNVITVHLCFLRSRSSVNVSPHPSHCRRCCGLSALRAGLFPSCAASALLVSLVRFSVPSLSNFLFADFSLQYVNSNTKRK